MVYGLKTLLTIYTPECENFGISYRTYRNLSFERPPRLNAFLQRFGFSQFLKKLINLDNLFYKYEQYLSCKFWGKLKT